MARGSAQAILNDLSAPVAFRRSVVAVGVSLFWLPVCLTIGVTWRFRARRLRYASLLAALGGVAVAGEALWAVFLQSAARFPGPPLSAQLVGRLDTNLVFFVSIVALVWLRERRHERAELERQVAAMDAAVATEQLYVLALQLHPHFLFNTLNLASQLVYSDPAGARHTIANLRLLLIESLEHASSRDVPLKEELRFLSSYLAIQRSRFGDRLTVTVDAEPTTLDAAVPHLLLQPLVENAIAHGIGARDRGGRVDLLVRRERGRLRLTIEDDGVGLPDCIAEGFGLGLTRQRLQQLFVGDYLLALGRTPTGTGTRIEIDVPYRPWTAPTALTQATPAPSAAVRGTQRASWWTRLSLPVQVGGAWIAIALLWLAADAPHMHGVSAGAWARQSAFGLANAFLWAVLSLVPLALSRRFDIGEGARVKPVAAHLLAACATSLVHLGAWLALLHQFGRIQFDIQMRNRFAWFVWDIAVYTTIVALATVASLGRRSHDAALEIQRAEAELLRTRLAGLRLRLQPSMLVSSLDAVAAALEGTPQHAERVIARLGDFLRALLATRDHDYSTLDGEIELLGAYLDVVGPVPIRIEGCGSAGRRSALVPATFAPALAAVLGRLVEVDACCDGRQLTLTFVADDDADPDLHAARESLAGCYGGDAALETLRDHNRLEIRVAMPLRVLDSDDDRMLNAERAVA